MDYNHPMLFAFLAEEICRECVNLCKQNCSGCKDNLSSELLHWHAHLNTLEKLREHFEQVRGTLLGNVALFYKCIENKLPHSEDKKHDQMIYLLNARAFLTSCNPETIYWGRYVTRDDDTYISNTLNKLVMS